MVFSKKSTSD